MTRKQCKLCPWKKATNPHEIPGGYSVDKHRALTRTIAVPGSIEWFQQGGGDLRVMACHETAPGEEVPCVGWLVNQLGEGNNIPLRFAVRMGKFSADVEVDGEQHATLEDTFPGRR